MRGISGGIYARSYRRSDMYKLVIHALAYRENKSSEEIEEQLRSDQFAIPAEVRHILRPDDQAAELNIPTGYLERVKNRFAWTIERFVHPGFKPDPRIEKVAEYLEDFVEVDNDVRDH